jgi:hypothetical protein
VWGVEVPEAILHLRSLDTGFGRPQWLVYPRVLGGSVVDLAIRQADVCKYSTHLLLTPIRRLEIVEDHDMHLLTRKVAIERFKLCPINPPADVPAAIQIPREGGREGAAIQIPNNQNASDDGKTCERMSTGRQVSGG